MRRDRKPMVLLPLIMITLLCTGCWDGIEINRRSVIFSLAFDKNTGDNSELIDSSPQRYMVTYAVPDMSKISGEESLSKDIVSLETVGSPTISTSIEEVQTKMQNTVSLGHTKAILLGEDLLSDPVMMSEIIDSLERTMLVSRSTPVFAVRGLAKDIIGVESNQNPVLGLYIMNYVNNNERARGGYKEALLGTLVRDLRESNSVIIPTIDIIDENKIDIKGGALLKDFKLKTWLTAEEIRGILWVGGKIRNTMIAIPADESYLSYTVREQDCNIRFYIENSEIRCTLDITNEGEISEYYINSAKPLTDPKYIEQIERSISQRIKQEVEHLISQSKEYKADVAGIGIEMYRQHPKWWAGISGNWEELYPNIPIEIKVDTKIRRTGIIN